MLHDALLHAAVDGQHEHVPLVLVVAVWKVVRQELAVWREEQLVGSSPPGRLQDLERSVAHVRNGDLPGLIVPRREHGEPAAVGRPVHRVEVADLVVAVKSSRLRSAGAAEDHHADLVEVDLCRVPVRAPPIRQLLAVG